MVEQPPLLDWRRGHDRDVSVAAPRHQIVLDAAPCQVIEDLVSRNVRAADEPSKLDHVYHVEIADAPIANFACTDQRGKGVERFLEWYIAAPVQQIEIEAVCSKPPQTVLARVHCPRPCRIVGENLADKEQLVAASGDGFANERLGSAVSVHFCGVDQRHAEIEADAERRNFVLSMSRVFGHAPCPLAKRGYRLARGQR